MLQLNSYRAHYPEINKFVKNLVIFLLAVVIPYDIIFIVIPYFGYEFFISRLPIYIYLAYQFITNFCLFHATLKDNNTKEWKSKLNLNNNIEVKKSDTTDLIDNRNIKERKLKNSTVKRKEMEFCDKCNVEKFSRSQHCPICDVCILRKDHHCFFLGGCVGISNQRYFFLTSLWLVIGSTYALSYFYVIYENFFHEIVEVKIIHMLCPIIFIISSILNAKNNLSNYLMIFICYLHIFAFFIGTVFGCRNIYHILKGKTSYDRYLVENKKIDVKPDGKTMMERLRFTFGNHWYINLILPNYWENIVIEKNMITNIFYPPSLKK
uniref:Palmitoyltransferase n=1 Tax=Strongyloides papillosus TaxID=174720 RepID=A0A0N5BK73_STREA